MARFMAWNEQTGEGRFGTYAELYQWSIDRPERFWPALWRFCDVHAQQPWQTVLEYPQRMPGARWFTGSRLNYAANLLRRRDGHTAIVFRGEAGQRQTLSYRQLRQQSAQLAAALREEGIQPGDRIAAVMPNIPDTVIAMLASSAVGAVWSSCSPDFGLESMLDRLGQIRPKVLFACDGYRYNARGFDTTGLIASLREAVPSIERVVIIPFLNPVPDIGAIRSACLWDDYLAPHSGAALECTALPFDHPLFILFSSGTTGLPKCIVHGAGGTLLQHLKELVLHTDLREQDRIFFFTTCGWMMWNWLISALATGATLVLYDGSPFHPGPEALLDMATQERVTIFGGGAKYFSALEKAGLQPQRTHDLTPLKTILSTGSPLAPETFDYIYRDIKADIQLSSISGGTDIISCFALGNPLLPVYRGELQCPGLGMRIEVFDEAGKSLPRGKGELVCSAPFPSMPVGFWNDTDGQRYRQAYFSRYPGVWAHGDYAELTAHGGLIIHGRSDAVLNPGGVRIGTAEIYRQVEALPEILECIAVAQEWHEDVRIILFVRLQPGRSLNATLVKAIKTAIRTHASPRHVPAKVLQVADIPRTRSGKIVELAVRDVIHGRKVTNIGALANPEALDHYRDLVALDED